jgi:hypothetical protein
VSALLLPTGRVAGTAVSVRVNGAPGVKVTRAVALRLLTVAVTVATPEMVELSVTLALPPLVAAVPLLSVPRLVVKLIGVPLATGLPNWSVAVAVSALLWPAGSVDGTAVRVRVNGAPGVKVTSAVALRLLTAAVTVATPAIVELSVTLALPPLVAAVPLLSVPRLVVKLIGVPLATGLPNWSVAVAVSALLWPAGSVDGTAVRVRVNGAPGVKVTSAVALRLPTVAVTAATPAVG